MRLKFNYTKNTSDVLINNQEFMNSYVHKCLGRNNKFHDTKNYYSISNLRGGKLNSENGILNFENGAYFIVSSLNQEFLNRFLIGVMNNQELFSGMKFCGVDYIEEKFIDGWNHFATLSPFLVKKYNDKKTYSFLTLTDENFREELKTYLINKISKINPKLDITGFDIIIPDNSTHKVKKVMVKNVINKANQCHVSIYCNKQVAELLYNFGLGQSTGSGFGTIYKTENHHLYTTQQ